VLVIEIYSSLECPFAYMAVYRLRQVWPEYAGRVQIIWRALSLEYANRRGPAKPTTEVELGLLKQIEPGLPLQVWSRPDWEWPVTLWPAFEALACAQAQSSEAAFAMSWALRHAFFAESRNIALRNELFAIGQAVAKEVELDLTRLEDDWDSGRYKCTVIADSRRGWHDLKVAGSPTFIMPDGRQVANPAEGHIDVDEEHATVRHYTPFTGDPLSVFRSMLESVATTRQP